VRYKDTKKKKKVSEIKGKNTAEGSSLIVKIKIREEKRENV